MKWDEKMMNRLTKKIASFTPKLVVIIMVTSFFAIFIVSCKSLITFEKREHSETDNPLEIEIMTDLTFVKSDMSNDYWTEFQNITNAELNVIWVPGNEYATRLDMVLASGVIPEVVFGLEHNRPTLINAIRQGSFWDLTPFLGDFSEYPNLRDKMTPGSWNYVTVDGKIMGVPRSRSLIDSGLKLRKDWLENLNLPVPSTIDEYKNVLIEIVNSDPSGNGKTIGLAMGAVPDPSLQAAFGVYRPTYDSDGGLIYNWLTPQFTHLIEWLKDLYTEGVLPAEFAALNNIQLMDLVKSGRAASYHYAIYRDYMWTEEIRNVQPEGELFTLPPMKGPYGDYSANLDIGTRGAQHISKEVPEQKVKQILQFFDSTASEEITDFAYYGKEGVHFNVVDGNRILTDLGKEQMHVNNLHPITPAYSRWGKVIAPGAPTEWNEAKKIEASLYEQLGTIDSFRYLISDTWIEVWPKYESMLQKMWVKAITGQISMDEYKNYVEEVKSDPKIKRAFREFAEDLNRRR